MVMFSELPQVVADPGVAAADLILGWRRTATQIEAPASGSSAAAARKVRGEAS